MRHHMQFPSYFRVSSQGTKKNFEDSINGLFTHSLMEQGKFYTEVFTLESQLYRYLKPIVMFLKKELMRYKNAIGSSPCTGTCTA